LKHLAKKKKRKRGIVGERVGSMGVVDAMKKRVNLVRDLSIKRKGLGGKTTRRKTMRNLVIEIEIEIVHSFDESWIGDLLDSNGLLSRLPLL